MAQIQERFARIARHNPERLPAAPKPALEPVRSKGHASEHAGELVATAVIAALVLILAGWFAP